MAQELKDILSHLPGDIGQETLLLYLQNKLSPQQAHEVEKKLLENDFDGDAIDGLREMKDKQQIAGVVEMINRDLKKRLLKKKQRREKMKIKDQPWLYVSVLILIFLIVIAYLVIRSYLDHH